MPLRNLLIIAIAIIASVACYSVAARNRYANVFAEALAVVETRALQSIPQQELFNAAMDGLTSKLDQHSSYLHGQQYQAFNEDISQHFGGLGIFLAASSDIGRLKIRTAFPGSPADQAGILPGDQIIAVDGAALVDIAPAERVKRIKGEVGQTVRLTIARQNKEIEVAVERAIIEVPSVRGDRWLPDGDWKYLLPEKPTLGYVRIVSFGRETTAEFEHALQQLDGQMEGLIIDLRSNSGGLLNCAVELCDMLLPVGPTIVTIKTRQRRILEQPFHSETKPLLPTTIPIVVLIDRNSASASEIMAGCLQDHGRAILIGEQSWGKGTVQDVLPIERGESALKLTTASYWRPSGKNIDRDFAKVNGDGFWGVQPDEGFEIEQDERTVDLIQYLVSERELRELTGGIQSPESMLAKQQGSDSESPNVELRNVELPNPNASTADEAPATIKFDAPDASDKNDLPEDVPLRRAVEYLESRVAPAAAAA